MVDKEKFEEFLKTRDEIRARVAIIFNEWQQINLDICGFVWKGMVEPGQMRPLHSVVYNSDWMIINKSYLYSVELPTEWIFDPDWKEKCRAALIESSGKEMIELLSC